MFRHLPSIVLTLVFVVMYCDSSYGQVEIGIDDIFLPPSGSTTTGSFEVYLRLNGEPEPDLTGFQVTLNLIEASAPSTTGHFTTISAPTARPYVMAPNSTVPVGSISGGGAVVEIGDFLLSGQSTAADNDGFARISFELDAGSQVGDEYLIEISTSPDDSFLATTGNGRLAFSASNGRISVVPEPGSLALLILGGGLILTQRSRKVRCRSAAIQGAC